MQNTQSFLNILISMRQNQFTQDDIWQYCLEHTSDLSDNLKQLSEYTRENIHGAQMLSEKMVTKLLQFLFLLLGQEYVLMLGHLQLCQRLQWLRLPQIPKFIP